MWVDATLDQSIAKHNTNFKSRKNFKKLSSLDLEGRIYKLETDLKIFLKLLFDQDKKMLNIIGKQNSKSFS